MLGMGSILCLLGVVGVIVFLILTIVQGIKKRRKTGRNLGLIGFSFLLIAVGSMLVNKSDTQSAAALPTKEEKEVQATDAKADADAAAKKKEEAAADKKAEQEAEAKAKAEEEAQAKADAEEEAKADKEAELMAYHTETTRIYTDLGKYITDFGNQNTQASQNPALIADTDWTVDTVVALTGIQSSIKEYRAIENVPEEFAESNRLANQAWDEWQFVIDNYPAAIDNLDVDMIRECASHMQNATGYLDDALNTFKEESNNYEDNI